MEPTRRLEDRIRAAVQAGDVNLVKQLLSENPGANLLALDQYGNNYANLAAEFPQAFEVLKWAFNFDQDGVNHTNANQYNVLHNAALKFNREAFAFLIGAGKNINDDLAIGGLTPLILAVSAEKEEDMDLQDFLQQKLEFLRWIFDTYDARVLDIDQKTKSGNTALHYAAAIAFLEKYGIFWQEAYDLLEAQGASIGIVNVHDLTAPEKLRRARTKFQKQTQRRK